MVEESISRKKGCYINVTSDSRIGQDSSHHSFITTLAFASRISVQRWRDGVCCTTSTLVGPFQISPYKPLPKYTKVSTAVQPSFSSKKDTRAPAVVELQSPRELVTSSSQAGGRPEEGGRLSKIGAIRVTGQAQKHPMGYTGSWICVRNLEKGAKRFPRRGCN